MVNIAGANINLPKVNISNFFDRLGTIATWGLIIGIVGFIVFLFIYNKKQKQLFKYYIYIYEEVAGKFIRVKSDMAKELIVPDSNISIFFLKNAGIYLPRPVRNMGLNEYWFVIRKNREWVNFEMSNFNELTKQAGYDFDYTDTRYAYLNLKEIIKRNYRDKVAKWWEKYQGLIYMVVLLLAFALAMGYIVKQLNKTVGQMGENEAEQTKQMDMEMKIQQQYVELFERLYGSGYTFQSYTVNDTTGGG
ncbi:MAG: hypothetical protein WC711_04040 [Candidatus Staskawiczbacteria bacterium]|jgi:hypothetical protein